MNACYAVIDIGSNTVKYSLYRLGEGEAPHKTGGDSVTVRLLDEIREGMLSPEGLRRLCEALVRFREDALRASVREDRLLCIATAAFRRLREGEEAVAEIRRRTGLAVRILSGEEEAALSFRGMLLTASPRPFAGLMLDMGGGSTECIRFEGETPLEARSHPFGALSLYSGLVKGEFPTAAEAAEIRGFVRSAVRPFFEVPIPPSPDRLCHAYVVGGTAKAVAALNKETVLPERRFSLAAFRTQLAAYLAGEGLSPMKETYPERYRVILPGMLAYDEIFTLAGVGEIHVPDGGLRDGVLAEFLRAHPGEGNF